MGVQSVVAEPVNKRGFVMVTEFSIVQGRRSLGKLD